MIFLVNTFQVTLFAHWLTVGRKKTDNTHRQTRGASLKEKLQEDGFYLEQRMGQHRCNWKFGFLRLFPHRSCSLERCLCWRWKSFHVIRKTNLGFSFSFFSSVDYFWLYVEQWLHLLTWQNYGQALKQL